MRDHSGAINMLYANPVLQESKTIEPQASMDSKSAPNPVLARLQETAKKQKLPELADRLGTLNAWMGSDLCALEEAICGASSGDDNLAKRAARHLLEQPGKRIRPLCVVLAARLADVPMNVTLRDLAVACELVHAATLLHDDVIDDSTERRGAPASRILYGNSASILAGDHLLVEALRRVHCAQVPDLMNDLFNVLSQMVDAESIQLARRGGLRPDRESYDHVVRGKTASLFGFAMLAGAKAAKLPEHQVNELFNAGINLGIAFQLVDDVLDFAEDSDTTGKDTLRDIQDGKMTWPLILACERDPAIGHELEKVLGNPDLLLATDWEKSFRTMIAKTGALEDSTARARTFAADAITSLETLPDTMARAALVTLVQTAVFRLS